MIQEPGLVAAFTCTPGMTCYPMGTSAFGLAPQGANSEPPSEHPSDGVSYVVEVTLVEPANLTNEAFRVYHAHL